MKVHNHRLIRDDAVAARFAASPHSGGMIAPRFPGLNRYSIGIEVEVLAQHGLWWQVDVVGEVNGVMDIVGWRHSKYLAPVNA